MELKSKIVSQEMVKALVGRPTEEVFASVYCNNIKDNVAKRIAANKAGK